MSYSTTPQPIAFYSKQCKYSCIFLKSSPQKVMFENLFGQPKPAPNASFYNGDREHNLNMKAQNNIFLSQSPKAAVYLK